MRPPLQPSPAGGRGRFCEAAARLAGIAGALLGWRPDEFWAATPAELGAVLGAMMPEEEGATGADLKRLRAMFPDEGEAPPPRFARSPSPARAGEDSYG